MLATLSDCFPYYPILIPLALFLIITTDSKFDAADTGDQRYSRIEEETAFVNRRNLMLQATNKTPVLQWGEEELLHRPRDLRDEAGHRLTFSVL